MPEACSKKYDELCKNKDYVEKVYKKGTKGIIYCGKNPSEGL